MNEIVPGLFLGGYQAANNVKNLKERGITHILSLNTAPLPQRISSQFTYLYVHIDDVEDTNILKEFPRITEFISSALDKPHSPAQTSGGGGSDDVIQGDGDGGGGGGGAIFVHCMMGISRSSTAVLAFLMQRDKKPLAQTLALVKSRRPVVSPNPSFIQQLLLWESMRWRLDATHPAFKQHQLFFDTLDTATHEELVDKFVRLDNDAAALDKTTTKSSNSGDEDDVVRFDCATCGFALFSNENLLDHYLPTDCAYLRSFAATKWWDDDVMRQQDNEEEKVEEEKSPMLAVQNVLEELRAWNSHTSESVMQSVANIAHVGVRAYACKRGELFVQPIDWMKSQILQQNKRGDDDDHDDDHDDEEEEEATAEQTGEVRCLKCPGCAIRIGAYNWLGKRCACGKWMIPAFHINKQSCIASKVAQH